MMRWPVIMLSPVRQMEQRFGRAVKNPIFLTAFVQRTWFTWLERQNFDACCASPARLFPVE
jgi:hypothetical protein